MRLYLIIDGRTKAADVMMYEAGQYGRKEVSSDNSVERSSHSENASMKRNC